MRSSRSVGVKRLLSTSNVWSPVLNHEEILATPFSSVDDDEAEMMAKKQYDKDLFLMAAIPPIMAFISYGQVARGIATLIDLLGFQGSNVDGNAFATNLLRPTINGVVGESGGQGAACESFRKTIIPNSNLGAYA